MAGTNPYIQQSRTRLPQQRYRVTFRLLESGETHEVVVEPRSLPYQRSGLPGSLLDIALGNGIELEHTCGGVCACSTCHSIVRQGLASCNEATEDEEDQLEEARGLTIQSRLSCQCVPDGSMDLVVEIPAWNRNLVKEAPH
ncbi:MAG: 2Fe-2S iron-sulfur cluster binding domain-containing protein [Armatimonadetes bacterium]|nr:2Fe-2S iron-sulfur cluster binding domain-containing protein [Armatimonadota bacterium]